MESRTTLVTRAADAYIGHLEQLLNGPGLSAQGRIAAETLIQSIARAQERGYQLQVGDVSFTKTLLDGLSSSELLLLINSWTLGLGCQDAPVVVMGTEHAFDIADTETFALENCASPILWLSNAGPQLIAAITANDAYTNPAYRPYHLHPTDYSPELRWNHTWQFVALAVDAPLRDLGLHTYQIERSALPAKRASDGLVGTEDRLEFLLHVVTELRSTARVLILHGRTGDSAGDEWGNVNSRLTRAFLETTVLDPAELPDSSYPGSIKVWRGTGKMVIHTRALNGTAVNREYCGEVANLVASGLESPLA